MASEAAEMLRATALSLPHDEAAVRILLVLFPKIADIAATLDLLVPVIGGMAGKLGMNDDDIQKLIDLAASNNSPKS